MTWPDAQHVPETPHVEQVIVTYILRGKGKDERDPVRRVLQVHRFDGSLVAENDPCAPEAPDVSA